MTAPLHPDPPDVSGELIPSVHLPPDAEIKAGLRAALARIQAEEHNAAMFANRLSPEDLADTASGDIAPETVQAFEQAAVTREAEDLKELFEERAAILEHDAGMAPVDAELEAARITATLARNRGCLWASLRSALSGYPSLLAQLPDGPGPVDSLPFGTATVHVREDATPRPVSGSIVITDAELEAARKGRTVVKQGGFTGAPEVKS